MGIQGAASPLLLVLLLAASPVWGEQCRSGCGGRASGFEPGTVYTYEYEGKTAARLSGAEDDVATMALKATATVSSLPDCVISVSVSNVQVTGADSKVYPGGQKLEGKPVVATLSGGELSEEVCTDNSEDDPSLNIKRAILSLLQTADSGPGHSSITQTDVFGRCPTEVDYHRGGKKIRVKKTRKLRTCQNRYNPVLPFTTVAYHSDSDIQGSVVFDGDYKSDQIVENGVVESAASQEVYTYIGMTSTDKSTKVKVEAEMKLVKTAKGAVTPGGTTKTQSIIFEVVHNDGDDMTEAATRVMSKLCTGEGEVKDDSAKLFAYLVRILRKSNKATMTNTFNSIKAGSVCGQDKDSAKKIFLDAISQSRSAEAIEVMADMLKSNEVTGPKSKMWYLALGMVDHASIPSLKSTLELLNNDSPMEAYLGIGSLVGKYCRDHNCKNKPEVMELEKKLASPLMKGCQTSNIKEEDALIGSMKGLGNTGYLSDEVVSNLIKCAADKNIKSRVRVAALEALRTDPNKAQVKTPVISILKNIEEDSEIRIKAYLVLVECPCPKTAAVIQEVLNKDLSYQVTAYIISHLRNIRSTVQYGREKQKEHFGKINTKFVVPFDLRKYSNNAELSYQFDTLNMGAGVETNVIFSQKSWIPRSTSLNLTTHMFGRSINLLEVGARIENLDRIIEHALGPKGYANTASPDEITSEANSMFRKFMAKAKQSFRPKRGVPRDQIESFSKKVDMGKDAEEKELNIDLSLKMQGSEIGWMSWHGNDVNEDPMEKFFGFVDTTVDKAKNAEMDYKKHAMLLDAAAEVPTGLGLPLRVQLGVAAAVRVKLDGKIDIPAIMKDPKNAAISFQLLPSAAVEGSTVVSMDGAVVESGVKIGVNGHTSTGSDLTARILNGKGIDVKVGIPMAKQDLISAKTDVYAYTVTRNTMTKHQPTFNSRKEEYSGCFDQVADVIGLTFCGEVSVPWDGAKTLSPIYGPSHFSVHIEKDDPSINSFHFRALYTSQKDAPQNQFEVVLETPNSKKERKIGLTIENTVSPIKALKVEASSPWGGGKFEGSIVNLPGEHSINADLKIADQEYMFKAGVKGTPVTSGTTKYEPFLEYKAPEKTRTMIGRKGAPKSAPPITVSGDVLVEEKDRSRKFTFRSVKVNTGRQEFTVDGTASESPGEADFNLKVLYDKENIVIKGSSSTKEDRNGIKLKRSIQILPSQYQDLGINANWDLSYSRSPKSVIESEINVVHGPDPNNEMSKVTIKNYWSVAKGDSKSPPVIDLQNSVSYPLVSLTGKGNYYSAPNQIGYVIEGQFEKYNAGSGFQAKLKGKRNTEYEVEFTLGWMGSKMEITATRDEPGPDQSKYTHALVLSPGGKYTFDIDATHRIAADVDIQVDSKMTFPSDPKNIRIKLGMKDSSAESNGLLWIQAGDKNLIDAKGQLKKGGSPQGNMKILLPGLVESTGNFKMANNILEAHGNINMIKANRKMDGKARLTLSPGYTGHIDLCADSKCVKITTNTQGNIEKFDSSNNLEWGDIKITIKAKNDVSQGKVAGSIEGGTSQGRHVKISYGHMLAIEKGDVQLEAGFEDRAKAGQSPRKLDLKVQAKHVDIENAAGDGQGTLVYVDSNGKDLTIHASLKNSPSANKYTVSAAGGAKGSLISHPIDGKVDVTLGPGISASWTVKGKAQDIELSVTGSGSDKNLNNDLTVTAPNIKTLKWITSNSWDIAPKGASLKVKTHNTLKWDESKMLKVGGDGSMDKVGVTYKVEWETDTIPKRTLQGDIHAKKKDSRDTLNGKLTLTSSQEQAEISWKGELDEKTGLASASAEGRVAGPTNLDFKVQGKGKVIQPTDDTRGGFEGEYSATVNGDTHSGLAKIDLSETHPIVDLRASCPRGEYIFQYETEKVSAKHYRTNAHVKTPSGEAKSRSEINMEDENNFIIEIDGDNSWYKVKGLQFRSSIDPDKQVVFTAKLDSKVVLSGKADYEVTVEDGKSKVKGTGNINWQGADHKLNYNGMCTRVKNGGECSFEAKTDKHSLEIETKFIPSHILVRRKYCGDKCSEGIVEHKVNIEGPTKMEAKTHIYLDASLFMKDASDMKFHSEMKRDGTNYDQNAELVLSPQSVYKIVSYQSSSKAGWSVTFGKRTVAGEALLSVPKSGKNGGRIEGSLWMDKQRAPEKKLVVSVQGEAGPKDQGWAAQGEAKIAHPALPRSLALRVKSSAGTKGRSLVDGAFELDVLGSSANKLTGIFKFGHVKKSDSANADATATLKSEGLGIDIGFESKSQISNAGIVHSEKLTYVDAGKQKNEFTGKVEIKAQKVHLLAKIPNKVIYEYLGKLETNDAGYIIQNSYTVLGEKYTETIELKKMKSLNYKFNFGKGCENKVYTSESSLVPKESAKWVTSFDSKSVFAVGVSLAENSFLKPEYKYDIDNIKALWKCMMKDTMQLVSLGEATYKQDSELISNEINSRSESLKKILPDYTPLVRAYTNDLSLIQEEIMADKHIQEIVESLKETISPFVEQVVIMMEQSSQFISSVTKSAQEVFNKLSDAVREIIPKLSAAFEELAKATTQILEEWLDFAMQIMDIVLDEIKAHQDDIKALLDTTLEAFEEFGKVFAQSAMKLVAAFQEFFKENIEHFKDLPIAEMFKEQMATLQEMDWDFLSVSENLAEIAGLIIQGLEELKDNIPTPELRKFLETIINWIDLVFQQKKKVNHQDYLNRAGDELASAIKPLVTTMTQQLMALSDDASFPSVDSLSFIRPLKPAGGLRLSIINWILSPDHHSFVTLIAAFLPPLSPEEWIPPYPGHAYIIGGSEIITYDGRHINVGGDCDYLMTQDYIDSNFTIVASFRGGNLVAIQVNDHDNMIELIHGKKPLVNGKESEFPAIVGDLKAWRRPATVGVRSKSGAKVLCVPDCSRCKVILSGFYFGKVRGVLGTFNNEIFDDTILPNGKIEEDDTKFLQAWSLGSCSAKSTPVPEDIPEKCQELDKETVELLLCSAVMDSDPYVGACAKLIDKGVDPEQAFCNVATAYAHACIRRVPAAPPTECMSCPGMKPDEEKKLTAPYDKADVLFVVELEEANKENYEALTEPLVNNLKTQFATQGINDVKFAVLGFGNKYPIYYTNDGKISGDSVAQNLNFKPTPPRTPKENPLLEIYNDVKQTATVELGITERAIAYIDVVDNYNWRMDAARTVISIHSYPCLGSNSLELLQHAFFIGLYNNHGIIVNLITPVEGLSAKGHKVDEILGFNKDKVFLVSDSKMNGNKDLEDSLKYKKDVCYPFSTLTGGTVFNKDAAVGHLQQVAMGIVDNVVSDINTEYDCTCVPKFNIYDGFYSKTECTFI